jgi:2'-hydroxyisoflavone reductase
MNILVLGGTQFLGRHFVNAAVKREHQITLFNRGTTNPDLFKDIETVIGDRTGDLTKIRERRFDCVFDTSGYFPTNVADVARFLEHQVNQYAFVSSCSVLDHSDQTILSFDENAKLVNLDIDINDTSWDTYGARKFLCEEEVRKAFPTNHFIVRPGLIVGPYDPTYRFPYWADRLSEGGIVLAPGDPDAPLQFIDARDLSDWILHGIETRICGTFNANSPHDRLTIGGFIQNVKSTINPGCEIKWISEAFLREQNVACWGQLPLWVYKEIQGFLKVNSDKAIAAGLKFRPVTESISDTHAWSKDIYKNEFINKTLSRKQEQQLLSHAASHSMC